MLAIIIGYALVLNPAGTSLNFLNIVSGSIGHKNVMINKFKQIAILAPGNGVFLLKTALLMTPTNN